MGEVKRPPRSQGRWALGWRGTADAYMDQQDARIAELEAQATRHEAELREARRKALEEAADIAGCTLGIGLNCAAAIRAIIEKEGGDAVPLERKGIM